MKKAYLIQLLAGLAALALIFTACPDVDAPDDGVTDPERLLLNGPTPTILSGNGRLVVKWSAVKGASEYQVYIGTSSDPSAARSTGTTSETSYVITYYDSPYSSLSNGTTYYVWVRSVKPDGNAGPFGRSAKGTPLAATGVPSQVSELKAVPAQLDITLSWNEVLEASVYTIWQGKWIDDPENPGTDILDFSNLTANLQMSSYTVTGLYPNTEYQFKVIPENEWGEGPESQISATTLGPWTLELNKWEDKTLKAGTDVHLYTVEVPAGKTYRIQLNEARGVYGDGTKTAQLTVKAGWTDAGYWNFMNSSTHGTWVNPIRADNSAGAAARTVEIEVSPFVAGTYAIRYYDDADEDAVLYTPPITVWVDYNYSGKVAVSWARAEGAEGYNVYRAGSRDGTYVKINSTPVAQAATARISYDDNTVIPGTGNMYYYKVVTVKGGKESPFSEPIDIIMLVPFKIKEDTEYKNTSSSDHLYTFDVSSGKTYAFSMTNISWWEVYDTDGEAIHSSTAYVDFTAAKTETVFILVRPQSSWNAYAIRVSEEGKAKPIGTPSSVSAQGYKDEGTGAFSVVITWDYSTTTADQAALIKFNIYRSTSEFATYSKVGGGVTDTSLRTWTDTTVAQGNDYFYKVSAENAYGEWNKSSASTKVSFKRPAVPSVYNANFQFDSGGPYIFISWDSDSLADNYNIYRSETSSGSGTLIDTISDSYYYDYTVSVGTKYYYRVSAENWVGESSKSAPVSAGIGSVTSLSKDTWKDDDFDGTTGEKWYSISVTAGTTYYFWRNSNGCDGTKTGLVNVVAWYAEGNEIFNSQGYGSYWGWNAPADFTPSTTTKVYIRVTPSSVGTYSIAYSTAEDPDTGAPIRPE